jgi:hypothetical protein
MNDAQVESTVYEWARQPNFDPVAFVREWDAHGAAVVSPEAPCYALLPDPTNGFSTQAIIPLFPAISFTRAYTPPAAAGARTNPTPRALGDPDHDGTPGALPSLGQHCNKNHICFSYNIHGCNLPDGHMSKGYPSRHICASCGDNHPFAPRKGGLPWCKVPPTQFKQTPPGPKNANEQPLGDGRGRKQ